MYIVKTLNKCLLNKSFWKYRSTNKDNSTRYNNVNNFININNLIYLEFIGNPYTWHNKNGNHVNYLFKVRPRSGQSFMNRVMSSLLCWASPYLWFWSWLILIHIIPSIIIVIETVINLKQNDFSIKISRLSSIWSTYIRDSYAYQLIRKRNILKHKKKKKGNW